MVLGRRGRRGCAHLRTLTTATIMRFLASAMLVLLSIGVVSVVETGVTYAAPAKPPTAGSWYVANTNPVTAYNSGCSHAEYANGVGTGGTVILDFGGQVNTSTNEDFAGQDISYGQIQLMAFYYAQGYYECSNGPSVILVIGTNNNVGNGSGLGTAWANEVNTIAEMVANYQSVSVIGGDDIEPSFGTQSATISWSNAYAAATGYPYLDYGSADGCSASTYTNSGCSNGWDQYGVWYVAYGSPAALSAPEIYYQGIAQQWEEINRYGSTYQNIGIAFWGPVDEYPRDSSTNTSTQAWNDLTNDTGQDPPYSMEFQAGSI